MAALIYRHSGTHFRPDRRLDCQGPFWELSRWQPLWYATANGLGCEDWNGGRRDHPRTSDRLHRAAGWKNRRWEASSSPFTRVLELVVVIVVILQHVFNRGAGSREELAERNIFVV